MWSEVWTPCWAWRCTAIRMSSQISALPPFSLKSSRKEICCEVSQLNIIIFLEKQVKVAHVHLPPFLIVTEDLGGFSIQRQSVSVESEGCRMPWLTFRRIIVSFTHAFFPKSPLYKKSYRGFLFKNRCISGAVDCRDVIDSGQLQDP